MPLDFLRETFEKLSMLNEEAFELTDDGIDALKDFEDENEEETDETVDIIDPEADTEEEANSSAHVGQVICECKVCHSNIFLDKDNVEYNVDTELCNEDDECPYCGETGGFTLVGEITEFKPEEGEEKEEETEEEETSELDDEVEETEEKTEVKEESLKENALLGGASASAAAGCGSALGDTVGDKLFGEEKECEEKECNDEECDEAYHSKHLCKGEECEEKEESKECNESIENITFEANGNTVTADDEKITIEAVNKSPDEFSTEEVVEPISDETAGEIVSNAEEETTEEVPEEEEEETEVDVDEIQEESFNTLGTNFLKRTYENVESFKTTSVKANDRKMVLEGIINFKSGTKKKTSFTFESATATKDGKLKFIGENKDIARGNKAFLIEGKIDNKSLIMESLRYNYRAKTPNGKSVRVSGTIKNDE